MRRAQVVGVAVVAGLGALVSGAREARACGGCFVPPPPPQVTQTESIITDEKMILSISMNQTTLYDQINYSGSPSLFAWVLPIKGTVTVGLSADILFQTINTLTATEVTSPPANCPPPPTCGGGGGAGCGASNSASFSSAGVPAAFGGADGATVTVTSQKQVGPYETVQLHSNDGSALTAWLTLHGYEIPDSTKPVIAAYVGQGFDFLALKLVPGEGVQSMQPVRVTSQGAAPSLPLHMVAVGTGATTGITIWVVADARWAPSNFPTFTIPDSQIAWDWSTSSSNYETLRLANEAALDGRGWQIESSLELSQYTIQQTLEQNIYADPNVLQGGYLAPVGLAPADAGTPGSDAAAPASDAGTPGAMRARREAMPAHPGATPARTRTMPGAKEMGASPTMPRLRMTAARTAATSRPRTRTSPCSSPGLPRPTCGSPACAATSPRPRSRSTWPSRPRATSRSSRTSTPRRSRLASRSAPSTTARAT